jgi:hypothetical protein
MSIKNRPDRHRIQLGQVSITDAAIKALEHAGAESVYLLSRHLRDDLGEISAQDALQNELALLLGMRVRSSCEISDNKLIWIVTTANRESTIIMLPDGHQKPEGTRHSD